MQRPYHFSALLLGLTGLALLAWGAYRLLTPSIVVSWSTATEFETAGYALYRSQNETGPFEKITADLLPASSDPLTGGDYEYVDTHVRAGETYYYQLEEIEYAGSTNREGPIVATAGWSGAAEGLLGLVLLGFAWIISRMSRRAAAQG